MFPALCSSYFSPVRLSRSATVGTSVFHQAPQCSGFRRLYSPCAGPVADAFASIRETRPVMWYSVRPCRKTCFHGLPRVSPRRCVSCIPSFHRVVSLCVVLSSAGYPVDDDRIAYQGYPVNPFFKSFSRPLALWSSPIFDDHDKEGKCPTRDIMKEQPTNS